MNQLFAAKHRNHFLAGHAILGMFPGRPFSNASHLAKLGGHKPGALVLDPSGVSAVPELLQLCRPPHVSRLVVAGVDNPVQGVLGGWPQPNVGEEQAEPAWAYPLREHGDTTTTVIPEVFTRAVSASVDHPNPRTILRTLGHSVSGRHFPAKTSAALNDAQITEGKNLHCSTIASTSPQRAGRTDSGPLNSNKPPKSLPRNISNGHSDHCSARHAELKGCI